MSILYILFAILGLGFLVFIHELGHYLVARRQGMRVEAFAIGFGKPIFSWVRDGVKWQICSLPFGGYVKIAGMQKEGDVEPSEIPDGFFGKTPWSRIKVALAGPVVNIVFSFLVFTFLWMSGGREKPFAEHSKRIGWVDPQSALYKNGVRPGDMIQKYDGRPFTGFKDLLFASIMSGEKTEIQGLKIDYLNGAKTPFSYTLKPYDNPEIVGKDKMHTIGVLSPARYLIYGGGEPLPGAPIADSGIKLKDRVLWADGEVLFSQQQLSALTNEPSAYLTVKRGTSIFQTKVPKVTLSNLKLSMPERGEIDDWQHEANIKGPFQDLTFIPYNLSPTLDVEGNIAFIDKLDEKKAYLACERCASFRLLQEGDHILAVDGKKVTTPYELLSYLQTKHMSMIVERDPSLSSKVLWKDAEKQYDMFNAQNLEKIIKSIGTDKQINSLGNLYLLKPVAPKPLQDFALSSDLKLKLSQELQHSKKEAEKIKDPEKRSAYLSLIDKAHSKAVLGLPLVDREVYYNPNPLEQFKDVIKETYRTLASLLTGSANPKYVAGPVGILQIVHQSWMMGPKEALFWMALISLNLGLINLLPLPVLDGGHIMFSLVEWITKRPIKAKTMEKFIVPFVVLLIGFFIFVTYNDLSRIFTKFF